MHLGRLGSARHAKLIGLTMRVIKQFNQNDCSPDKVPQPFLSAMKQLALQGIEPSDLLFHMISHWVEVNKDMVVAICCPQEIIRLSTWHALANSQPFCLRYYNHQQSHSSLAPGKRTFIEGRLCLRSSGSSMRW
jgi:hypothetical protein